MFPKQKELLGRVLGPSKNEGNQMAQNILTVHGTVVPRRSLRRLTQQEWASEAEKTKRQEFTLAITSKLGNSIKLPPTPEPSSPHDFDPREDDEAELLGWLDSDPLDPVDEKPIFEHSLHDTLVNAEVLLPQGEEMQHAKVKRHKVDDNGQVVGTYDPHPVLNSIIYDVEFPDGTVKEYSANVIAQNIYAAMDVEGREQHVLDSILDHAKDATAVSMNDKYIITKNGNKRMRKSTIGWSILVKWKDESEQWIPLDIMKGNYPVQMAEYATAHNIATEPAFAWWVPYTLRKRDAIISAVKARVRKTTHKFGIRVPNTIKEAIAIDKMNNNTLWQDSIAKEMKTILPAFDILSYGAKPPPGFTKSSGHLVFDVKMDFTRKSRWVKDGHLTADPVDSNYAGAVSRESVRIAFTYAALNGLNVCAADILSAYLQAPTSEKHYIICGAEFPIEYQGCVAVIKRALYGGKSAGSDYWKHMRTCMDHIGFSPCMSDPDVWMRKAIKESDGTDYWEYVLLYVDDTLCISMNPSDVIEKEIGKYWKLKPGSLGPPSIYLGNKVTKVTLENGVSAWSFSSSQYVQEAVKNVEEYLKRKDQKLPSYAPAPFTSNYRPEIDISAELDPESASYYQSLIGILRWIVELGRIDITCEVSLMASMMALPRIGHLQQLFHIFAYLKQRHNAEMVFDPSTPDIDMNMFPKQDWSYTPYGNAKEVIPPNIPKPRSLGFTMTAFVDSDHAGDEISRKSRSRFIIRLNNAPIFWSSKKQNGIELSSYGSEFMAMKECCEYIRGLRIKLRMMGIPVEEPTFIFGDNKSMLASSTIPTSTLKKKSNSIAYNYVREGHAKDEWRATYINTHLNIADVLTKPLGGGEKRKQFVGMLLHHVY